MGRSIPSFRRRIEIEHLVWSEFKKELKSKNDKKSFDGLFDNAKLYTPYLSSANRPIPIEPIMMGMLFHHYKTLLDLATNNTNKEFGVDEEIVTLEIFKPRTKDLFDETYERWLGLINSLHKEDREQFLKMLVECCNGLGEGAANIIMEKDSKSVSVHFFFCLVLQNQKLIDRLKTSAEEKENIKTIDTLVEFVDWNG